MCLRVLLVVFCPFLLYPCTESSETCNILKHFLSPNSDLIPDYPKNDICRWRGSPHCCTRSVEATMKQYANTDAHALFFNHILQMRDTSAKQFDILQNMDLPYLSDDFRKTALKYNLINDVSHSRGTLIEEATIDYLGLFYSIDHIPNFCKSRVIQNMKPHVHKFLQELLFSHQLVQNNWQVAEDLFQTIFSAKFHDQCIHNLIQSGMTRMSCKSCTDSTIRIPTCFDYCVDVATVCLKPFQPIILLFNDWFNVNVKVQTRLNELIHFEQFAKIRNELLKLINRELNDEFYADVCRYHFRNEEQNDTPNNKDYELSKNTTYQPKIERRKRIAKTAPPTQTYSTRYISFPATTPPSPEHSPVVAGGQLFNVDMICFNATRSITNWGCWTAEGVGDYMKSKHRVPIDAPVIQSDIDSHIPIIKSKLNELLTMIDYEVVVEAPSESNDVEYIGARTSPSRAETVTLSNWHHVLILFIIIKINGFIN